MTWQPPPSFTSPPTKQDDSEAVTAAAAAVAEEPQRKQKASPLSLSPVTPPSSSSADNTRTATATVSPEKGAKSSISSSSTSNMKKKSPKWAPTFVVGSTCTAFEEVTSKTADSNERSKSKANTVVVNRSSSTVTEPYETSSSQVQPPTRMLSLQSPTRSSMQTTTSSVPPSTTSVFIPPPLLVSPTKTMKEKEEDDDDDDDDEQEGNLTSLDKKSWHESLYVSGIEETNGRTNNHGDDDKDNNNNVEEPTASVLADALSTSTRDNNDNNNDDDDDDLHDYDYDDMIQSTMLQTQFEWNQIVVSKAFQPYKNMIRYLDTDNFPSTKNTTKDREEEERTVLDDVDVDDDDDGFFQCLFGSYDDDNDDDDDDNKQQYKKFIDIRNHMIKDTGLTEREIAAFFEGMKLYRTKVTSLRSQLAGLKATMKENQEEEHQEHRQQQDQERLQRSLELRKFSSILLHNNRNTTSSGLNRSATMTPVYNSNSPYKRASIAAPGQVTFQTSSPKSSVHQHQLNQGDAIRPFSKSLRGMSIARVRNTVNSMKDDDDTDDGGEVAIQSNIIEKPSSSSDANNNSKKEEVQANEYHEAPSISNPSGGIIGKKKDLQRLLKELEEAEKYQRRLEKQLQQAGVVIAEDIPYDFAKDKVLQIAQRMAEIGSSDNPDPTLREEYFHLERDMEKYTTALQLTDEWIEEQADMERQWEDSISITNEEALRKVRRHMPVDVKLLSETALFSQPTPNGKFLPKSIARKFKRTNSLQLLRIDPEDIVRMHPSTLENMRVTGLTLTERRALYVHLKDVGPRWKAMQSDKMTERKWNWFNMMKANFKENVDAWQRHIDQYGPPDNHPYITSKDHPKDGCPLIGKQCPLKADKIIDYDGDYGFPEDAVYLKTDVKKSEVDNPSKAKQEALEAAREKKESERRDALKRHYKGKILQVSLANGSCEAMDELMDKIEATQENIVRNRLSTREENDISESAKKEVAAFEDVLNELKLSILAFAERSGMQLTGKRDSRFDKPDTRSMVELTLCEEVIEIAKYFFEGVEERMEEIQIRDGRMKSTIHQLRQLLEELHDCNTKSIQKLSDTEESTPRSRKLKTRETIASEIQKEIDQLEARKTGNKSDDAPTAANKNAGGNSASGGDSGGRSVLIDALKARGGGRGNSAGRGGLMAAIAARSTTN